MTLAGVGSLDDGPPVLLPEERRAACWQTADMRVSDEVNAAVDASRPDAVIHLAGVAFPPQGELNPAATYEVNTIGAVRLLASLGDRRRAGVIDPSSSSSARDCNMARTTRQRCRCARTRHSVPSASMRRVRRRRS